MDEIDDGRDSDLCVNTCFRKFDIYHFAAKYATVIIFLYSASPSISRISGQKFADIYHRHFSVPMSPSSGTGWSSSSVCRQGWLSVEGDVFSMSG